MNHLISHIFEKYDIWAFQNRIDRSHKTFRSKYVICWSFIIFENFHLWVQILIFTKKFDDCNHNINGRAGRNPLRGIRPSETFTVLLKVLLQLISKVFSLVSVSKSLEISKCTQCLRSKVVFLETFNFLKYLNLPVIKNIRVRTFTFFNV